MAKNATPQSGDGSPTGPFRGSHRALLAEVSDMVTVSDREGRILYATPATESVTGHTPEQFAAMRPFETIHPEDRPRCEEAFERLAGEPGLSLEIEHRFRHKDGSWRWVEGTFRSLFEEPEVGGLVATVRDITERKRAEEALRGSEERLQLALDASAMGTFTYYPEEDRSVPDARMLELFGLPEDGVLNLAAALEIMIHPEDGERYAEAVARSTDPAGSGELREEICLIHPDGSEHWVSVMARVFFEGERPRRMVGNAMEVTERKRAEEVLRESEERQAFLLKLSDAIRPLAHPVEIQRTAMDVVAGHLSIASAVYFDKDPDGARAAVREGYKSARIAFPSSVRISDFGSFMPGDFRKGETISYEDAETDPRLEAQRDTFRALGIRAGVGVPLVKARRLAAVLAINHTQPRRCTDGELRLLEEVTERTWSAVERARAEEALRESEEKYRMLVENVGGHAVFLLDADGLVTEWTASARRVKGYSAEEVIGRHLSQFCTPEEIEAGEPGRELAEAAETGRAEREAWRVKKGGERIWVNEVATAVRNDDGELVGFAKIARDLTERMRAEEALRESEERYRLAVEAADLGRWELVPDTGEFHTSSTCNRHLGIPEDARPTHEGHFEHIHPDDHAMIHERLGRAFQEGGEFEVEYRVIHMAGGVRRNPLPRPHAAQLGLYPRPPHGHHARRHRGQGARGGEGEGPRPRAHRPGRGRRARAHKPRATR